MEAAAEPELHEAVDLAAVNVAGRVFSVGREFRAGQFHSRAEIPALPVGEVSGQQAENDLPAVSSGRPSCISQTDAGRLGDTRDTHGTYMGESRERFQPLAEPVI